VEVVQFLHSHLGATLIGLFADLLERFSSFIVLPCKVDINWHLSTLWRFSLSRWSQCGVQTGATKTAP